jgi:hypothetical protein
MPPAYPEFSGLSIMYNGPGSERDFTVLISPPLFIIMNSKE